MIEVDARNGTDRALLFDALRALIMDCAPAASITRDDPGHVELVGPAKDPKTGNLAWFGMVKTGARAVSFHLMPLYANPVIGETLSEGRKKRRQGNHVSTSLTQNRPF